MKNIKVLIDEYKIKSRIEEIANEISNKYKDEEVILVCVLKGGIYFTLELFKNIKNNNIILDFVKVKSYGNNVREATGNIQFDLDMCETIENRNVIIVEDIIDSGYTLKYLYDYLKFKNPKSLEICVLLDKKERRKVEVSVEYTGFLIEDKFVLGCGLDYDEKYRNLPYVGYVE